MRTIETLSNLECDKLLSQLITESTSPNQIRKSLRNQLAILLMLDAGLRVSEMLSIKIGKLWYSGTPAQAIEIEASISKNHQSRIVPTSKRLQGIIQLCHDQFWVNDINSPYFFAIPGKSGLEPLTARMVQHIVARASLAALGRKIHPHILRHTFATRLMRCTNVATVQRLLGHKSIQSTQVYMHPDMSDLQAAINML